MEILAVIGLLIVYGLGPEWNGRIFKEFITKVLTKIKP